MASFGSSRPFTDRIPPEIIICIFEELQKQDVSSLRLTSKAFAHLGAKAMFQTIDVLFSYKSLGHIKAISEDPNLSKLVHEIRYDDFYIGCVKQAYFEKVMFRLWHEQSSLGIVLSASREEMMLKAWENYKTFVRGQRRLLYEDIFEETCIDVFERLPNLTSIRISSTLGLKAQRLCSEMMFCPPDFRSSYFWRDISRPSRMVRTARTLLHACRSANINLTDLEISNIDWAFLIEDMGSESKTPHIPIAALGNLKHFGLSITGEIKVDLWHSMALVKKMLKPSMKSLESLSLSFNQEADDSQMLVFFARFCRMNWDNLKNLSLGFINLTHDKFIGFCKRHRETLRNVTLTQVSVTEGSWANVFTSMKRHLKLENIQLVGLFTEVLVAIPSNGIGTMFDQCIGFDATDYTTEFENFFLGDGQLPALKFTSRNTPWDDVEQENGNRYSDDWDAEEDSESDLESDSDGEEIFW
ncbi:hypothetical protein BP5796_13158 [Coleophoma crateriformis]|uniref:F-box domain-containing protein n=1 Tax=Coleophoma crateriformis TaxID=565419 RepID=A0A3D8Q480_9HELO|nr:hypothetical protein BP5796_13158 [Coleophoma crateriformis]